MGNVSLSIAPGERHVLIGPNGAGKTTLFHLISGELRASEGRIVLFGEDVTALASYRRAARGMARTFQITNLFPNLTVMENVLLACEALERRKFSMLRPLSSYRDLNERAAQLLRDFGLWELRGEHARNISYGDQRKVEIALSVAGRPRLLLLDEPMAGLSGGESEAMQRLLHALDPAITVLLIEHDMDMAFAFAQRITVLYQGRVLTSGPKDEVRANPGGAGNLSGSARGLMIALDMQDVHTYYGDSHVLQGVTLQVTRGTVAALLGRNGVGKTTLCRSIVGFTPARTGRIRFNDGDIMRLPPHKICRLRISLVPQGRRIFSSLTVKENLEIAVRGAAEAGVAARGDVKQRWDLPAVFALFPRLAERGHHRGNELSGGEQQMLAIARALVANPLLLLMDEPTEGLAPALVAEVGALIRRLKDEGMSILLVEQNAAFAVKVADTVHVMSKGKIVHSSEPAALWENQEIKTRLLGVPG